MKSLRSLLKDLKYLTKTKSKSMFGEEIPEKRFELRNVVKNELQTILDDLKKNGIKFTPAFFSKKGSITSTGKCIDNLNSLKENTNKYISSFNNILDNNFKFGYITEGLLTQAYDRRSYKKCPTKYKKVRAELLDSLMDLDKRISILEKKEPTLNDFMPLSERVKEKYFSSLKENENRRLTSGLAYIGVGGSAINVLSVYNKIAQDDLNRIMLLSIIITEILIKFGERILKI